jgi:phosphoribosylformylglycinamidine cyclo-ligase
VSGNTGSGGNGGNDAGATTSLDYRSAGVDIEAADDAKGRLKRLVESTRTAGMRGAFGGFGGMFRMPSGLTSPLLVASADGVGTKIKVAIEADRHDTVGHCLVNHCTNDILVQGARPLFFLDYVAFGKLEPVVVEGVVTGVAAGCRENACALIGGETAEMPGLYTPPDYDLAGFIVGCVEEARVLGSERVRNGDVLIGLASSGLHTNGYSLARRIVTERLRLGPHDRFPGEDGSVADVLLRVHQSYLAALVPVLDADGADDHVHAMAHITGGGIPGNLNRALPDDLDAIVETATWEVPNAFQVLERAGAVPRDEMFRAFNMGVGMVVVATASGADAIVASAAAAGIHAWQLGRVQPGSGRVILS